MDGTVSLETVSEREGWSGMAVNAGVEAAVVTAVAGADADVVVAAAGDDDAVGDDGFGLRNEYAGIDPSVGL
jgi:hypothetical protein